MRRIGKQIHKWTAQFLDLPHDVVMDIPRITLIGSMQLYIENHRGVLHFSRELLRLKLAKGSMEVQGRELVIRAILPEEVFVEGTILGVRYIED